MASNFQEQRAKSNNKFFHNLNYPFDTEISQDVPLQDKNPTEFTPWIPKNNHKNNLIINDVKKMNHKFLQKIKITSHLSKQIGNSQHQKGEKYISWLKNNLKAQIDKEGIRSSDYEQKNQSSPKFVEHRSSLYRTSKVLKIYHKPKPIQLSFQFVQSQQNHQHHHALNSPFSISDRITKGKKQNSKNKKDKKLSVLDNYHESREGYRVNAINPHKNFYQTLQLKLNRGQNIGDRKREKRSLMTSQKRNPTLELGNSRNGLYGVLKHGHNNMQSIGSDDQYFSCRGKNVLTNQYQTRKQRIRILSQKKELHQSIFLV